MQHDLQQSPQKSTSPRKNSMQECIDNCNTCFQVCNQVLSHCLSMGGKHANPDHIKLLIDCASICNISSEFMTRESKYHSVTCAACAEICQACADSCETIDQDDQFMKSCAKAIKACMESCKRMSTMQ